MADSDASAAAGDAGGRISQFHTPDGFEDRLHAFRHGLRDTGYVEGVNVAIEYRWAGINWIDCRCLQPNWFAVGRRDRRREHYFGVGSKSGDRDDSDCFVSVADPVRVGLVSNLARPDGNLTGISFVASELTAKRVELLRELVRGAKRIAVLVNPANAELVGTTLKEIEQLRTPWGCKSRFSTPPPGVRSMRFSQTLGATAQTPLRRRGPLFTSRRVQLANLSARHALQ